MLLHSLPTGYLVYLIIIQYLMVILVTGVRWGPTDALSDNCLLTDNWIAGGYQLCPSLPAWDTDLCSVAAA